MPQLVQPIQRRDLVRLGQRRVVEDVVDEVIDGSIERHDGLADVDQLGGAGADGVHAEDRVIVLVDQELEHAVVVAEQLAAGEFAVLGDAGFVRDAGVR